MSLDEQIMVCDPLTGSVERPLQPPTTAELEERVASLRAAQVAWADRPAAERAELLLALRDAIAAARTPLIAALEKDTGRTIESAIEVDAILATLTRWAASAPGLLGEQPWTATSVPGIDVAPARHPYAVVGVISPWNFPLLLGLIDTIPALAAGCSVTVKPSEVTPRFVEPLRAAVATVPEIASVLEFVEGGGQTGAAIIDLVDCVAFTGSVETGRRVALAAAGRLIPAFLELGGKDAALVLADADLERAARAILWGGTTNAGQSCLSIERVYVEEPVAEEFSRLLAELATQVPLGQGGLGPFIDPRQAATVTSHVADAVAKGATVRAGGEIQDRNGGKWCPATVLTGVDHSMTVMTDETFGPVLPVMVVADADEAVRLANDTAYGLSAAVFAGTVEKAMSVARRLRAGAVSINDASLTAFVHEGEKDSFGVSGLGGSRMGPAGLTRFLRRQALIVNESANPDPWWWPTTTTAR